MPPQLNTDPASPDVEGLTRTREPSSDNTQTDEADEESCLDCEGDILPGLVTDMDFPGGIQRCDSCEQYGGDLDATKAAADLVGGTVWCMAESDQTHLPEGVRTRWSGTPDADNGTRNDPGLVLVSGNNPWVEVDDVPVVWAYTRLLLGEPRELIVTVNKLGRTWTGTREELIEAARAVLAAPIASDPSQPA